MGGGAAFPDLLERAGQGGELSCVRHVQLVYPHSLDIRKGKVLPETVQTRGKHYMRAFKRAAGQGEGVEARQVPAVVSAPSLGLLGSESHCRVSGGDVYLTPTQLESHPPSYHHAAVLVVVLIGLSWRKYWL